MSYQPLPGTADFSWNGPANYTPLNGTADFSWNTTPPVEAGGTLAAPAPVIAGTAEHDTGGIITAAGQAHAPVLAITGLAHFTRHHIASGQITAPVFVLQGVAHFSNAREATGAPVSPLPQVQGGAVRGAVATGVITAPMPLPAGAAEWGQKIRIPTLSTSTTAAGDQGIGLGWQIATPVDMALTFRHTESRHCDTQAGAAWADAQPLDIAVATPHDAMQVLDHSIHARWQWFQNAINAGSRLLHTAPPAMDLSHALRWQGQFNQQISVGCEQPWIVPPTKEREFGLRWFNVDCYTEKPVWDTRDYSGPLLGTADFHWTSPGTYNPDPLNLDFSWGAPNPHGDQPIRPTDGVLIAAHKVPDALDVPNTVCWGPEGSWLRPPPDYGINTGWEVEPEEPAPRPPQPIIREVYIFMPSITLYRLPDGAEFEASNVSWSTDADSWGWRFSATLHDAAHLALVKPDTNGNKEIACIINGHEFRGIVESYSRSRQFGKTSYTLQGRSLSAWLAEPYAPKRSKLITAAYTARQLAELELANTGWTLDWQTADWPVPANVFSYEQLQPTGAIKRIADAVDAVVQSHPANKVLTVRPRYPIDPHKWAEPTTPLDAILPYDLCDSEGGSFTTRPAYNRAIVTGGAQGGVIVTVTRDGTAGDELAPVASDDLITDQLAGYERGRNLIAAGGSWEELNLSTMLTDPLTAPGLILPGHLVELQEGATAEPALITGTTINAASSETELKVRQQLTAIKRA